MTKQPSFSDLEYTHKKKTTRRERFLQEMDSIIPWSVLVKPIKRCYPQGHTGRPPVPLEAMLRIYFLQQWYGLSDPAAEDSLYDTESMRRFVGVDLDSIPDESTILRFRHRLETGQRDTHFQIAFDDFPDAVTWFGVSIIVGSGLYVSHHESKLAGIDGNA